MQSKLKESFINFCPDNPSFLKEFLCKLWNEIFGDYWVRKMHGYKLNISFNWMHNYTLTVTVTDIKLEKMCIFYTENIKIFLKARVDWTGTVSGWSIYILQTISSRVKDWEIQDCTASLHHQLSSKIDEIYFSADFAPSNLRPSVQEKLLYQGLALHPSSQYQKQ